MSCCAKARVELTLRSRAQASTILLFCLVGLVPAQAFRASRSEAAPTDPNNGKTEIER